MTDVFEQRARLHRPHARQIDYDPVTQTRTMWAVDADGTYRIWEEQEVNPVVDISRELYKEIGNARWGDGQRVATIPLAVWSRLEKAGITRDDKALKKWLNDPDNRDFRTRPGRV